MPRLVNLGSLCIDRVYRVSEIASAGETVASQSFSIYPGGKGLNQSLAAAKAGAEVIHHGCIGADGDWLKDVLTDGGVNSEGVLEVEGETGHAVIQVNDQGENSIVIVGGTNRSISPDKIENVLTTMAEDDWLLLQNEINDLELVLDLAARYQRHVAFNIAPVDGREQNYDLAKVEVLIVNEVEAAALSHTNVPAQAVEQLVRMYPTTHIVLTLGRDGLRYGYGDVRQELPSLKVTAVDETAAGDAFIGYFMASLLNGATITDALRAGSVAGAYAVTKEGAAVSIPSKDEFHAFEEKIT